MITTVIKFFILLVLLSLGSGCKQKDDCNNYSLVIDHILENTKATEVKLLKSSSNGLWEHILVDSINCSMIHLNEQLKKIEKLTEHTCNLKTLDKDISFFEISKNFETPRVVTPTVYIFLSNLYKERGVTYVNYIERYTGSLAINHFLKIEANKVEEIRCRTNIEY